MVAAFTMPLDRLYRDSPSEYLPENVKWDNRFTENCLITIEFTNT